MKKILIPMMLIFALIFSACSNNAVDSGNTSASKEVATEEKENSEAVEETKTETIIYESETGPVEVPARAERVVVLSSFASGSVMALDTNIVGIDMWSKMNPRYEKYIKDAVEVSDESLEKIIEIEPDLIIVPSTSKNIEKLKAIAPTVSFTYGSVDYLEKFLEVGKLLNKEKQAKEWIDDFKGRAEKAGEDIRAKIGEDATISVIESFDKQLYVFGNNWGRSTEIIYQEMELNMPEKVKEMALKAGYYAISAEVLPDFAGDYLIFSKDIDADNSFQETEIYKNLPAVKNNRVFEANAKEFYYNDPITLDFQLDFIKKSLLGE